jgi:hypothetical protein
MGVFATVFTVGVSGSKIGATAWAARNSRAGCILVIRLLSQRV